MYYLKISIKIYCPEKVNIPTRSKIYPEHHNQSWALSLKYSTGNWKCIPRSLRCGGKQEVVMKMNVAEIVRALNKPRVNK